MRAKTTPVQLARVARRTLSAAGVSLSGQDVLALVSGGPDSVALVATLDALPRGARPRRLEVLFLDHGMRDVSTDRAAAREAAAQAGAPFHERTAQPGQFEANMQAAARSWRYREAVLLAIDRQLPIVCTGHQADDQLESMLLGLVSSSGLRSFAGMPVSRPLADGVQLVRPLLGLARSDLRAWCESAQRPHVEDPTNRRADRPRTMLRAQAIPALLEAHPGAGRNLERSRAAIERGGSTLDALAGHVGAIAMDAAGDLDLRLLPLADRSALGAVLAWWLRKRGIGRGLSSDIVERVCALAAAPAPSSDHEVGVAGAKVARDGYYLRLHLRARPGREVVDPRRQEQVP